MRLRPILLLASALLLSTVAPASAETRGAQPCPREREAAWSGAAAATSVSIPSLTRPAGIAAYQGTMLRPVRPSGRRPVVVLQHGLNGSQCGLWWAARDLAGHGYVTLVWTAPAGGQKAESYRSALDATRSAIAFARSTRSPYDAISDRRRVAVAGMSLGSIVASVVQADEASGIRAAIAFDNLRRWVTGDPGAASGQCLGEPALEVTPRVPALGFAMDEPCRSTPDRDEPGLKQAGFRHWQAAGQPTMELVMRGFEHGDFAGAGSDEQRRLLAHYVRAWLDRWLLRDREAADRLLARRVGGRRTTAILSSTFRSGASLPGLVDTRDYVRWLSR